STRSSRVVAVQVPVPGDHGEPQPPPVLGPYREQAEPGDRPLPALVVAVEQLDRERLVPLGAVPDQAEQLFARVAQGALPEAEVTGWHVQVAGEPPEVRQRGMVGRGG